MLILLTSIVSGSFPDPDCRYLPDWSQWRSALQTHASIDETIRFSEGVLLALQDDSTRQMATLECPYGLITADILTALRYVEAEDTENAQKYFDLVSVGFSRTSFLFWIGTEWPIFQLSLNPHFMQINHNKGMTDCPESGIIDWTAFRRIMTSGENWFLPSLKYLFDPALSDVDRAMAECPIGFATVHAVKGMICANTESICFRHHVLYIDHIMATISLDKLAASEWNFLDLLLHAKRMVVRHPYKLDFTPIELTSLSPPITSDSMKDVEQVLHALDRSLDEGIVTTTMFYGSKFNKKASKFLRRAKAVGIKQLVAFALDEEAFDICERYNKGFCVRGSPSILNKFTLPLVFLNAGFDVLWLDLDLFLFKNPLPYVRAKQRESKVDVLTASSFAADCVCSGIVFLRANDLVRNWWLHVTSWVYRHPYEHDQKTVSAFLKAGEVVASADQLPRIDFPLFDYLEAGNQFVSSRHVEVGGWTGNISDIVVYHFLNGDSDSTALLNPAEARDDVFYDDLMEAFYGETIDDSLFDKGDVLPHHVSSELSRLVSQSRWEARPDARRICVGAVPVTNA